MLSYTIKAGGCLYSRFAWTGGDIPPKGLRFKPYRELVRAYFREQIAECGGLDLWTCAGTSCLDRSRIFWNRARLDAWRTLRENYLRK